jgi:hypothetical protein
MVPYKILYRKKFYRKRIFLKIRPSLDKIIFFRLKKEFYIIVLDKLCYAKYHTVNIEDVVSTEKVGVLDFQLKKGIQNE